LLLSPYFSVKITFENSHRLAAGASDSAHRLCAPYKFLYYIIIIITSILIYLLRILITKHKTGCQ